MAEFEIWQLVGLFDRHLDEGVAQEYKDQPLAQDWARVSKVNEEAGEAVQALIALTGQNPRKGVTGTLGELLDELADTALTAIYAIQHFTKDEGTTRRIIEHKVVYHSQRVGLLDLSGCGTSAGLPALSDAKPTSVNVGTGAGSDYDSDEAFR